MIPLLIIIALVLARLLVPLLILRYRFWGLAAAIVADAVDAAFLRINGFEMGSVPYQEADKFLDLYYLSLAFYASRSLMEEVLARRILMVLFLWRAFGVVLFEVLGMRQILFFAPNIFEFFYIGVFGAKKFFPGISLTRPRNVVVILLLALGLKMPQEYVMHYLEFPWGFGNFKDGICQLFIR
jgi:hypothetical protein